MTSKHAPFKFTDSLERAWTYYSSGLLRYQTDKMKVASYPILGSSGVSVFFTHQDEPVSATFTHMDAVLGKITTTHGLEFITFDDSLGRYWYCAWPPGGAVTVVCFPYGVAKSDKAITSHDITIWLDNTAWAPHQSFVPKILIKDMSEFLTAFLAYQTAIEEEDDI